ncbi:MAG: hypothetical protein JNM80_15245 [Phycisphaerae bacterium]|nr:hypothetical protein [Phycisphaerae bacterium]
MSAQPKIDVPRLHDAFRFDRRGLRRAVETGSAMAAFYDEDGAISLTRVDLVDSTPRGIGMMSPLEVEPGVRVCLYSGAWPMPHRAGIVTRCVPEGEGFRVGLRCDDRAAA